MKHLTISTPHGPQPPFLRECADTAAANMGGVVVGGPRLEPITFRGEEWDAWEFDIDTAPTGSTPQTEDYYLEGAKDFLAAAITSDLRRLAQDDANMASANALISIAESLANLATPATVTVKNVAPEQPKVLGLHGHCAQCDQPAPVPAQLPVPDHRSSRGRPPVVGFRHRSCRRCRGGAR